MGLPIRTLDKKIMIVSSIYWIKGETPISLNCIFGKILVLPYNPKLALKKRVFLPEEKSVLLLKTELDIVNATEK